MKPSSIITRLFPFLLLFAAVLFSTQSHGRQVRIRLINQYEASAGKFTLVEQGRSIAYESQRDGSCLVDVADGTDSLLIQPENHRPLKVAARELSDGAIITVHKQFTWKDLVNPMFYIVYGGLWLLLFIIFAETGLFAGFFLPGDSLLFVAGIYSKNLGQEFFKLLGMGNMTSEWPNLLVIIALVTLAGIIGNYVGYWFGRKIGPAMFQWKDNLLFKKKYLYQAQDFYNKHGGGAIVVARFIPIIRTFAPIVSGIVQMDRARFSFFNITGCIAWVSSMILGGHFLQQWILSRFGFNLKDHLEVIVIGIVLVSTLPVLIKLFSGKSKSA